MPPSPAPREGPDRGEESGTLDRFEDLAKRLLSVDQEEFRKAMEGDTEKRRAKRTT